MQIVHHSPIRWRKNALSVTLNQANIALLDLLVADAVAIGGMANRSEKIDEILTAYRETHPQYEPRVLELLAKRINKEMN